MLDFTPYFIMVMGHWVQHKAMAGNGPPLTHWGLGEMAATSEDYIFKCNFINENVLISISISSNFDPEGQTDNKISFSGDKPLTELMITQLNDAYMRHPASMSWLGKISKVPVKGYYLMKFSFKLYT